MPPISDTAGAGGSGGHDDETPSPDDDGTLWRRVTAGVTPLKPKRAAVRRPGAASAVPADPLGEEGPDRTRPAPVSKPRGPATPPAGRVAPDLGVGSAPGLDKRTLTRLRKGQIRIDGRIDLHGHTQEAAHRYLVGFLASSQAAGRRCVLVITGKGERGEGVLRQAVPRWLNEPATRARILAFCHAIPPDGGAGALYVLLRKKR